MWFIFALLTTLAWGTADLFYKRSSDPKDKYSHLKIVVMVGIVMGIHALGYMLVNSIRFDPIWLIKYLPVSSMYILSMTIGYVGLRYLDLSVASPVQNSSGALATILCVIFLSYQMQALEAVSIAAILIGVILLGVLEKKQGDKERKLSGENVPKKYQTGALAFIFPVLYCIIDALGTFADGIYLDEMELISEDNALLAYEFTFLIVGILVLLYLTVIKKEKFVIKKQGNSTLAAVFETAGQFFYVFAMSDNATIAVPIVAAYCVVSVLLSRIFLKEKLSKAQYAVVALVLAGIITLGVLEGMAEDGAI